MKEHETSRIRDRRWISRKKSSIYNLTVSPEEYGCLFLRFRAHGRRLKKRFVMTFDDAIPTLEWFQILQHAWLIKKIFNFESLHHLEQNTAFQHSIEHAFKGAFLSVIFHKSLNWDLTKTTASITGTLDTRSQGTFVHQTPVDPYRLLPRRHQNSKLLFTEGKVPVSIYRQL